MSVICGTACALEGEVMRLRVERDDAILTRDDRWSRHKEERRLRGIAEEDLAKVVAERDRLRAVLADTPETMARVACAFNGRGSDSSFVRPGDLDGARAVLAALRARAGVTP